MIKVTVLYPNEPDGRFDFAYWTGVHFPLLAELLGAALKGASAERGIGGMVPGAAAPYVAVANLLFDSIESFQGAFGPHAGAILGDLPKFTSLSPTVQISEVLL